MHILKVFGAKTQGYNRKFVLSIFRMVVENKWSICLVRSEFHEYNIDILILEILNNK